MYSIGSGWMNSELLQMWFDNDFLELVHTKKRPLLLLLDGHSSHINPDMIKMAAKESINFVCPLQHPCFSASGQDLLCTTQARPTPAEHKAFDEEFLQKAHKELLLRVKMRLFTSM